MVNTQQIKIEFSEQSRLSQETPVKKKDLSKGCNCQQSKCIKKYCECFAHGTSCSAMCRCKDCGNPKTADAPVMSLVKCEHQ